MGSLLVLQSAQALLSNLRTQSLEIFLGQITHQHNTTSETLSKGFRKGTGLLTPRLSLPCSATMILSSSLCMDSSENRLKTQNEGKYIVLSGINSNLDMQKCTKSANNETDQITSVSLSLPRPNFFNAWTSRRVYRYTASNR